MSEPQHPHTEGTQTGEGQSGPVSTGHRAASQSGHAAIAASFGSLAAAGACLAQLREAKGWSIDDVSARLKVPPAKMRALESGDVSHFPGTTFALGVVRSYAKMLGVDAAPFVQALRREKGEPEPDLSMPASTGTDLPRGRVSVSLGGTPRHRSWWWGVAAVAVGLVALVMWHSGGQPPAWLARLKASANGAAANSSGPSTTTAQGQTIASGTAAAADTGFAPASAPAAVAGAASEGQALTPTPLASLSAATPASAQQQPLPPAQAPASAAAVTPAPAAQSPALAAASAATPAEASAVPAGATTLSFAVTQDSWFSVRDKAGKEVFSGIVHAGDTKQVTGQAPLKVIAGNRAGLQSVTVDGKPVEAAKYGPIKGNVARFTLP
jgi:cytoskeleton protein RodZ